MQSPCEESDQEFQMSVQIPNLQTKKTYSFKITIRFNSKLYLSLKGAYRKNDPISSIYKRHSTVYDLKAEAFTSHKEFVPL